MTNPIICDSMLATIAKVGDDVANDYVFNNLHAGHPYTLWVSGTFGGGTPSVTPKWVDAAGNETEFPDFDPENTGRSGSHFVFSFRAPASV